MTEPRRKRVRVIRDSEKYRKHKFKKVLRKILTFSAAGLIVLLSLAFIWFLLSRLIVPPFQD